MFIGAYCPKTFSPIIDKVHFRSSDIYLFQALRVQNMKMMFRIDFSHKTHKTIKHMFSFENNWSYLIKVYRCSD